LACAPAGIRDRQNHKRVTFNPGTLLAIVLMPADRALQQRAAQDLTGQLQAIEELLARMKDLIWYQMTSINPCIAGEGDGRGGDKGVEIGQLLQLQPRAAIDVPNDWCPNFAPQSSYEAARGRCGRYARGREGWIARSM
jgi:hypothetical protein